MWQVLISGVWQAAESDELVLDWIERGWVRADTLVRHESWVQAQPAGTTQEFRDALPRASFAGMEQSLLRVEQAAERASYASRPPERPSYASQVPQRPSYASQVPPRPSYASQVPQRTSYGGYGPDDAGLGAAPSGSWRGPHPSGLHAFGYAMVAWTCCGPFSAVPAILLGARALRETRADPATYASAGPARFAIVIAWLDLYAWAACSLLVVRTYTPGMSYGMFVTAGLFGLLALACRSLPSLRGVRDSFHPLGVGGLALALALGGALPLVEARKQAQQEALRVEDGARNCPILAGDAMKLATNGAVPASRVESAYAAAETACRDGHQHRQAEAMGMAKKMHSPAAVADRERRRAEEAAKAAPPPPTPLSAEQLVRAYKENRAAGDVAYKDLVFPLTGQVGAVRKGTLGESYLVVTTTASLEKDVVHCYLQPSSIPAATRLVRGKPVTIEGTVKGPGAGTTVVMRDCRLPPP